MRLPPYPQPYIFLTCGVVLLDVAPRFLLRARTTLEPGPFLIGALAALLGCVGLVAATNVVLDLLMGAWHWEHEFRMFGGRVLAILLLTAAPWAIALAERRGRRSWLGWLLEGVGLACVVWGWSTEGRPMW